MPIVIEEGQFRFVIYTRENHFEPPHVHVWIGSEDVCRLKTVEETDKYIYHCRYFRMSNRLKRDFEPYNFASGNAAQGGEKVC